MFLNSTLIDFGCGMGQNTLVYDHLGASCTLLEYDNFSFENAKSLFSNHAKNRFNIINTDKFDFKVNEKFDFVISNGVAHHTHNPIKCLNICCDALKQGGFFILGIANKAGSFQRNLQRLILYSISNDNNDIIKYSKLLFKEHIRRSVRFSGRYANEIIYDAYINPKIYTFGTQDIMDIFFNNNITFYSSYDDLKDIRRFLEPNTNQFKF